MWFGRRNASVGEEGLGRNRRLGPGKKTWKSRLLWLQDEISLTWGPHGVENELGNEGPPHQRDTSEILFLAEMFHVPSISWLRSLPKMTMMPSHGFLRHQIIQMIQTSTVYFVHSDSQFCSPLLSLFSLWGFLVVKLKLAQKEALTKLAEWLETPTLQIFEAGWKHIGNQGTEYWCWAQICFKNSSYLCKEVLVFWSAIDSAPELVRLARRLMRQNRGAVCVFRDRFPFNHQTPKAKEEKACPKFGTSLKGCRFAKEFAPSWSRDLISAWTYVEFVGQMRMREIILTYSHLDTTSSQTRGCWRGSLVPYSAWRRGR